VAYARIELIALPGMPLVRPGDDLAALILEGIARAGEALRLGDALVIAQKIVSKAEDRFVDLRSVTPSARARELAAAAHKDARLVELILAESSQVLRHRPGVLIVVHRLGYVMANAGIDASNVEPAGQAERVLLLPVDPDATCASLRDSLAERVGARVAVVINDSTGRAFRNGTTGMALGAAGLPALQDLRGRLDLFGRPLIATEVGHADELAAAASLVQGQADEGTPVVLVRGLEAEAGSKAAALVRSAEDDLFR
jgi:coenzyme F420-0:L-glutamate ligase/coenzyme F420-1:gamma-L-glutamate ligase